MAEVLKAPVSGDSQALTRIKGRIIGSRKAGKQVATLIVIPAPDAYTSPQTVEVLSERRLGEVQEECAITCRVGGFRRAYNRSDSDGRQERVQTADNKLYAVE